jgi:hypothetical protein
VLRATETGFADVLDSEGPLHSRHGVAPDLRDVLANQVFDLLFESFDVRRCHGLGLARRAQVLNPAPERLPATTRFVRLTSTALAAGMEHHLGPAMARTLEHELAPAAARAMQTIIGHAMSEDVSARANVFAAVAHVASSPE